MKLILIDQRRPRPKILNTLRERARYFSSRLSGMFVLEESRTGSESTLSRLEDADIAQEATKFAKQSLKMELAANIMSRVTRLTDVLLPLVTQRVGGSGL